MKNKSSKYSWTNFIIVLLIGLLIVGYFIKSPTHKPIEPINAALFFKVQNIHIGKDPEGSNFRAVIGKLTNKTNESFETVEVTFFTYDKVGKRKLNSVASFYDLEPHAKVKLSALIWEDGVVRVKLAGIRVD